MKATGPLAGIKVIELSHIMAGPMCGLMLADMGADVIKLEKVPGGDDSRRMVPPMVDDESAAFMMLNRNKRGTAINLKSEEGKKIFRKIMSTADVLIENYRPGTMERLGLSYESLREENPGLIYCQVTGFGTTGPYAGRAGFDLIAQGISGLMSMTGEGAGRPPTKAGFPVTDGTAGLLAAMGILAAYIQRLKTGRGQRVDTSLLEAGIIHTAWPAAIYFATGASQGPLGSGHPLSAPYQAFETEDGWINIGAANQGNWLRMIEVIGMPDLNEDPRFSNNAVRMQNLPALIELLKLPFKTKTAQKWLSLFEEAGVPAGPVLSVGEMLNDPHVLAREMVVEVEHKHVGKTKALGSPVKFSETPSNIRRAAPVYGQHSREILSEYGYSDKEIDKLVAAGDVIESQE